MSERIVHVCEPCPHGDTLRGNIVRQTVACETWAEPQAKDFMGPYLASKYEAHFVPALSYVLHVGEPTNFGRELRLTLTAL